MQQLRTFLKNPIPNHHQNPNAFALYWLNPHDDLDGHHGMGEDHYLWELGGKNILRPIRQDQDDRE